MNGMVDKVRALARIIMGAGVTGKDRGRRRVMVCILCAEVDV